MTSVPDATTSGRSSLAWFESPRAVEFLVESCTLVACSRRARRGKRRALRGGEVEAAGRGVRVSGISTECLLAIFRGDFDPDLGWSSGLARRSA